MVWCQRRPCFLLRPSPECELGHPAGPSSQRIFFRTIPLSYILTILKFYTGIVGCSVPTDANRSAPTNSHAQVCFCRLWFSLRALLLQRRSFHNPTFPLTDIILFCLTTFSTHLYSSLTLRALFFFELSIHDLQTVGNTTAWGGFSVRLNINGPQHERC
jgi:hypothetical protein